MVKTQNENKVKAFFSNFDKVYSVTVKLYNSLCSRCRLKLHQAGLQSKRMNLDNGESNMKLTLDNLCPNCKVIYNDIVKGK